MVSVSKHSPQDLAKWATGKKVKKMDMENINTKQVKYTRECGKMINFKDGVNMNGQLAINTKESGAITIVTDTDVFSKMERLMRVVL